MADIQPPSEAHINGAAVGVGSKRQRKPSVRLGDIGVDPPYVDSHHHHPRRNTTTHKPYKTQSFSKDPNLSIKPSKTRPLTNLTSSPFQTLDSDGERERFDALAIGTWRIKESSKKRGPTKRARSNWVSTNEDMDFDVQNSESPFSEEHSPVENFGVDGLQLQHHRRTSSFKGSAGPSDTDDATRDWNNNNDNENCEDGVRVWLSGLGLSRYFPVFQVHEVDVEILPMLTLEDLKDMGISAVGTRRKMYSAIQKL
ncbi:hypothetical protein Lal_00006597 [Lupinus albus]|uniref:Putative sterile alpha motif/pointed domain-containing protein n=1 Tax=Lupinus albus TaxID=3870 RepID=A0A6A5MNF9_LUPAL|nr:putative sterile alpha motif/pointed domain-containing protein [Lupinus albus]KAF1875966.1 hypothetical protein Lal_00006597 [Lupinus albus]